MRQREAAYVNLLHLVLVSNIYLYPSFPLFSYFSLIQLFVFFSKFYFTLLFTQFAFSPSSILLFPFPFPFHSPFHFLSHLFFFFTFFSSLLIFSLISPSSFFSSTSSCLYTPYSKLSALPIFLKYASPSHFITLTYNHSPHCVCPLNFSFSSSICFFFSSPPLYHATLLHTSLPSFYLPFLPHCLFSPPP